MMEAPKLLDENRLADAWADLKAHADRGLPLQPDATRMAFADPEFLLRRETRGVRFQLEMLKPDLELQAQGIDNTIVVFGSARFVSPDEALAAQAAAQVGADPQVIAEANKQLENSKFYAHAREFAHLVSRYSAGKPRSERLYIATGGGPGVMEAANRGAHESGAPTVGLNIALPHEQRPNPYITPSLSFTFHYFALRKMHFLMRAVALVAFPGGFGTLDELFEVITLVQTGKVKPVPIVLFGTAHWKRLIDLDYLVELGTISQSDLSLYTYADDPVVAWQKIQSFYQLS